MKQKEKTPGNRGFSFYCKNGVGINARRRKDDGR
jgi:hypothetical protein